MEEKDYIARCPECGRILAAISGSFEKKAQANEVGKWIHFGLSVERATTTEVREAPWGHSTECKFER